MKIRVALITSLAVVLILVPGTSVLADQAVPAKWADCVAVLPGKQDDLGSVLTSMSIPYRSITSAELEDDVFLNQLCALFIASGSAARREAAPHLARWVEAGGSLYVSGSALDVVMNAFPGHLELAPSGQAPAGLTQIKVDQEAETALGQDLWVQASGGAWTQVKQGTLETRIHAYARLPSGDVPVALSFNSEQGWVVYHVLSAGSDTSDAQQRLVRYLVVRTLFARDAARTLQGRPAAYATPTLIAATLQPSTEYSYTARTGDDWDAALAWNGGSLSMTLVSPISTVVALQSASAPMVLPVRNSTGGTWKMNVSSADATSANAPFLLMLIPRRGTNLLNAVPAPRQVSTDTAVVGSNVGLALAMAIVLALSASLLAGTFAQRQGTSNRLLVAASSAASRAGGAFGSLFAPATWPAPPPTPRRP